MSLISTGQRTRDLADDPHVAAVATAGPNANSKPRTLLGLTMGLLAVAIGALYAVPPSSSTRAGRACATAPHDRVCPARGHGESPWCVSHAIRTPRPPRSFAMLRSG